MEIGNEIEIILPANIMSMVFAVQTLPSAPIQGESTVLILQGRK